jgi:hypothetical protein
VFSHPRPRVRHVFVLPVSTAYLSDVSNRGIKKTACFSFVLDGIKTKSSYREVAIMAVLADGRRRC